MSKRTIKIVRKPRHTFTLNAPCNIKVEGERVMRKNVVLVGVKGEPSVVQVRTGQRGRPARLDVTQIEKQRVLRAS